MMEMILAEYLRTNAKEAIQLIMTTGPIRNYIVSILDEAQLKWLSNEIVTNPTRLITYVNSAAGAQVIKDFIAAYALSTVPAPAPEIAQAPAPASVPTSVPSSIPTVSYAPPTYSIFPTAEKLK